MDCIVHTTKEKTPGFNLELEELTLELQLSAIFRYKTFFFILQARFNSISNIVSAVEMKRDELCSVYAT